MLNPVLQSKLLPEHRLLYSLKMPLSDKDLKEKIAASVKSIRSKTKRNAADKLEAKLAKYGNGGGWYIAHIKENVKSLYKQKQVSKEFLGDWRSIEFELIFKSLQDREEFCYAINSLGLTKFVTIQTDQSVKRNHNDITGVPSEVVLTYRVGLEDNVRSFCKALKGRAYVNSTCGTHFHIDARHLNREDVIKCGERISRAVPALRLMLPRERRENRFCAKDINSIEQECKGPEKYAFVNLTSYNKHRTIEVRGHSGTINAEKILKWVKLCEKIMLTDLNEEIKNVMDLINKYNLDEQLKLYVLERVAKFSSVVETEGEEKPDKTVDLLLHPKHLIIQQPVREAKAINKVK